MATSLVKIECIFKETMIETNIWRASQEKVFEFDVSAESYRVRFGDRKMG
jgi:hypothetical protein